MFAPRCEVAFNLPPVYVSTHQISENPLISTSDIETTAPLVATQDSVTTSAVPISPVAEATDAAGGNFSTTNKLWFDLALDIPLPNSDDDFSSDEDDSAASVPVIVKSVTSTTSTNHTILDEVLQPDCMKNYYLGLPWVPPPSKLLPYLSASADAHEVENADFDLLCTTLSLNAVAYLKLGLVFSHYKNMVNLSKAPQSSLLRNDEGYASVADLGGPRWELAILVLTGEYELAEGQLGAYYHSDSFYGPMSSGTLTSQTKKENQQGGASRPFSGSPSKGNRSKFVSGSPRKSAVTTGSEQFTIKNLTVSPFLEWDAEIPVYDGRAHSQSKYQGFSFAPKD
ncbi:hypothetical protein EV368DRAFT_89340 [Lentinula lateritia]|nr:hypothetical protein EV368DRAFT_89340 [Lentinula lateritia]